MKKYFFIPLCFAVFFIGCLQFVQAQQDESLNSFSEEDRRELQNFHLNDEVLDKYFKTAKDLQQYDKMHPDADLAHLRNKYSHLSFHNFGDALSKNTEIAAILKKNDIAPQQFVNASVVITIGYMMIGRQTAFLDGATEAGPETRGKMPDNMVPPILSDENAAYIQKNSVKIEAILQDLIRDAQNESEDENDRPKAAQVNIDRKATPQVDSASEHAVEDVKIGNFKQPARLPDPCEWYVKDVSAYCKQASPEECAKQLRTVLLEIDAHLKDTNVMFDSCKKAQEALPSR